jgi:hypothetical protein
MRGGLILQLKWEWSAATPHPHRRRHARKEPTKAERSRHPEASVAFAVRLTPFRVTVPNPLLIRKNIFFVLHFFFSGALKIFYLRLVRKKNAHPHCCSR